VLKELVAAKIDLAVRLISGGKSDEYDQPSGDEKCALISGGIFNALFFARDHTHAPLLELLQSDGQSLKTVDHMCLMLWKPGGLRHASSGHDDPTNDESISLLTLENQATPRPISSRPIPNRLVED
jgi:hypothetical protein